VSLDYAEDITTTITTQYYTLPSFVHSSEVNLVADITQNVDIGAPSIQFTLNLHSQVGRRFSGLLVD